MKKIFSITFILFIIVLASYSKKPSVFQTIGLNGKHCMMVRIDDLVDTDKMSEAVARAIQDLTVNKEVLNCMFDEYKNATHEVQVTPQQGEAAVWSRKEETNRKS